MQSTTSAYCAQPLRFLIVVLCSVIMFGACSEQPSESSALPSSYLALRKSDVVYGPLNESNPFEHVGLRHNDLVHAVVASARPWDTLSAGNLLERTRLTAAEWSAEHLGFTADEIGDHIQTAFAMGIDSMARYQLAAFDSDRMTTREIDYIRSIGEVLCSSGRFEDIEEALLDLETDILTEAWPAGDSTEIHARIAIAVAKHSFSYWKQMMITAHGLDGATASALSKTSTDVIELTTRADIIAAADVLVAVTTAENLEGVPILKRLGISILTGGAVSLIVAIVVYAKEIVGFLGSLLPWNW